MRADVPLEEIMIADVVTTSPETSIAETARLLRERGVSSVVVVEDGAPVGIVTKTDLATGICRHDDLGRRAVETVMSAPLETIPLGTTVVEAAERLRAMDAEHLPVVRGDGPASADDGKAGTLVGIVTGRDLSYYVPQLLRPSVGRREDEPPRRSVRTDTAYERDDWEFSYHGTRRDRVDVGDVAVFAKTVTAADVEAFADATGDTNRVHLDAAYAAGTRFGEPILHGVLSLGLVSAALARLPGLTVYLSQECSFRAPIAVGDRGRARCEIIEDLGRSKYRVETTVYDGADEPVLDGEAVVLIDDLPAIAEDGSATVEEEPAPVDERTGYDEE